MNPPAGQATHSLPTRPQFSAAEIAAVRGENPAHLHSLIPARCYYDEDIYKFEVEHILKKNWLAIGRWDWAEKPGDYFTTTMFGEPLVIVRDRAGTLRCLVNACRHRWARVVDEGSGNTSVLMCPYHRWTYNLDGTLRAVSRESIPGFDKDNCALPSLPLEIWEGTIFINFDPKAAPLAPQLTGLEPFISRFRLGEMRTAGRVTYDTSWNYKYSFETGYEAYHHCGIHNERLANYAPPEVHEKLALGKIWGVYGGRLPEAVDTPEHRFPAGGACPRPPSLDFHRHLSGADHLYQSAPDLHDYHRAHGCGSQSRLDAYIDCAVGHGAQAVRAGDSRHGRIHEERAG
jgi:phenylpropionate dioxygenase-like ring-hydroxylating dioxygenase large terminal subunit